jgi:hypothetical protein
MKVSDREKDDVLREFVAKMHEIRDMQPTEAGIQALKTDVGFLLDVAERDTGQSGRVRNFLLAFWNAEECGGFDLTGPLEPRHGNCRSDAADFVRASELPFLSGSTRLP